MTADVLLAARGLTRYYGRYCALRGIDLTLRRGEVLGFLGLNGAGKTTTMQILAGALAPHAGAVSVGGHDLGRSPRAARAGLGYLPQTPPLIDDMRVDEYLDFCAALHGLRGTSRVQARCAARSRCGLDGSGARLVRHLSQGYRQRLGLAQAIVHEPAVLILDEPTSGLDPAQIRDVRALIAELGKTHAVLISTHILSEVRTLATRVIILHEGRIVHDRPNDQSHGRLRARFQHAPPAGALERLPGVRGAAREADGGWLIDFDGAEERRAAFASAAVGAGWGLTELVPDYDALEHQFMQLTAGAAA